jgi:D-alanine-D-alanine ligase
MKRLDRLRVTVAVDSALATARQARDLHPSYRDYDYEVVRALSKKFERLQVIGVSSGQQALETMETLVASRPDVVFNLSYSAHRHEPSFLGALELLGLPFTGSGCLGILLSRDKMRSKLLLKAAGVPVPEGVAFRPNDSMALPPNCRFPMIVKPALFGGSSEGIFANSLVRAERELADRVRRIWARYSVPALCEEFVVGREVRIAVTKSELKGMRLVGATEWRFPRARDGWGFKTHRVRTDPAFRRRLAVEIRSLELAPRTRSLLLGLADTSMRALGIRGYATLDLRFADERSFRVLEVNANPGLSPHSPTWSSPSFESNLVEIVRCALERNPMMLP